MFKCLRSRLISVALFSAAISIPAGLSIAVALFVLLLSLSANAQTWQHMWATGERLEQLRSQGWTDVPYNENGVYSYDAYASDGTHLGPYILRRNGDSGTPEEIAKIDADRNREQLAGAMPFILSLLGEQAMQTSVYNPATEPGEGGTYFYSGSYAPPVPVSVGPSGSTTAIEPMENAMLKTGNVSEVAGYTVAGSRGLVGTSYNVNIWGLYDEGGAQGLNQLSNAFRTEARVSGATRLNITGHSLMNEQLLNPAIFGRAARMNGFTFRQVNPFTVHLSSPVK